MQIQISAGYRRRSAFASRRSDCFQRYARQAIDCNGQPALLRVGLHAGLFDLLRLEHTQEDFEINQRPEDPFVILPTFDMLAKEAAEFCSIADPRETVKLRCQACLVQIRGRVPSPTGRTVPGIQPFFGVEFRRGKRLLHACAQHSLPALGADQELVREARHDTRQHHIHERHPAFD